MLKSTVFLRIELLFQQLSHLSLKNLKALQLTEKPGWPQFLRLALPNFLMISEWWAAEAIVLLAGTLPNAEISLTAMAIFSNTCTWGWKSICFVCFFLGGGRFWSFEIWILTIWTFHPSPQKKRKLRFKSLGLPSFCESFWAQALAPWKIPPVMSNQDSGEKNARPCGLSGVMFFNVCCLSSNFWYLPKLVVWGLVAWGLVVWIPGILALKILKGFPDLNPKPPNHQSTISWIESISSNGCHPLIFIQVLLASTFPVAWDSLPTREWVMNWAQGNGAVPVLPRVWVVCWAFS